MLNLEEIIQTLKDKEETQNSKKGIVLLIKGIISDAKEFFTGLFDKISALKDNVFRVEVKNQIELPKIQKIEGEVAVKDIRSLIIGLNEIIKKQSEVIKSYEKGVGELKKSLKPEKVDFSRLEKAVKEIKIPEVKIPQPPKAIEITNLGELKKYFDELGKKFNIKFPDIEIPPFPKTVKVSNLAELKETKKPEPKLQSFFWEKDENGELKSLTEVYDTGEVRTTGWNLGRVKIDDKRS